MERKYQIFISSTYKDLIEARSKVRDAILSMMHFPIGMEMFNAADEEQWEIIQETIDSSDYYVLIIGQRYGSVIEEGADAGISYTEKEFRYAKEKKIPILVFIIEDKVPIMPEYIEDPEKREKLTAFKEQAMNGRVVQWWINVDELAGKVAESLHKQMDRKKRPGWIRGDAFDIETSHAEILNLNKRIRELEQENKELKSQVVERKPGLAAAFFLDQQEDKKDKKKLKTHGELLIANFDNRIKMKLHNNESVDYKNRYAPLDINCVESHLKKYVSEADLNAYNSALPSEEEIDTYVKKMQVYRAITEGGLAFKLLVSNEGTAKATDVRVLVTFPEEIFAFEIDNVEKQKAPEAPKLPENPIEKAEQRFVTGLTPLSRYFKSLEEDSFIPLNAWATADALLLDKPVTSVFEFLEIKNHEIRAECRELPHRYDKAFEGIYIVPTKKGKFKVPVSLMCSEYVEPEICYIEFEVL